MEEPEWYDRIARTTAGIAAEGGREQCARRLVALTVAFLVGKAVVRLHDEKKNKNVRAGRAVIAVQTRKSPYHTHRVSKS